MIKFKCYRWWLAWFGYSSYVKKTEDGETSYALIRGQSNRLDFKIRELGFKREY